MPAAHFSNGSVGRNSRRPESLTVVCEALGLAGTIPSERMALRERRIKVFDEKLSTELECCSAVTYGLFDATVFAGLSTCSIGNLAHRLRATVDAGSAGAGPTEARGTIGQAIHVRFVDVVVA